MASFYPFLNQIPNLRTGLQQGFVNGSTDTELQQNHTRMLPSDQTWFWGSFRVSPATTPTINSGSQTEKPGNNWSVLQDFNSQHKTNNMRQLSCYIKSFNPFFLILSCSRTKFLSFHFQVRVISEPLKRTQNLTKTWK